MVRINNLRPKTRSTNTFISPNLNPKTQNMILVRDVFRLKFGKAKEVKVLMEESRKLMEPERQKNSRVLFDLVGHAYTMVLESSYSSLAEYESEMSKTFGRKEWGEWYQKLVPNIEKSYREIFTVFQ